MSTYVFRKVKNNYEIAKFEDYAEPTAVYTLYSGKCSCPSRYRNCKHLKLLDSWKKDSEPVGAVYNESGTMIGSIFQ